MPTATRILRRHAENPQLTLPGPKLTSVELAERHERLPHLVHEYKAAQLTQQENAERDRQRLAEAVARMLRCSDECLSGCRAFDAEDDC
jgi:hypothetical protein